MKLITTFILTFFLSISSCCLAAENVFYMLRNNTPSRFVAAEQAFTSLTKHSNSIDILLTQGYRIDKDGIVWGSVDPEVLAFSKKNNIKLMLLVINTNFDAKTGHLFLANPTAQAQAIQSIVKACQQLHCYGVQFDFEMIALQDRDALTKFYQTATQALHKQGHVVSFAVAPVTSDNLLPSDFLKKMYVSWEGAYDLKKLGEIGDFISIMTYNQHLGKTTPGPTADIRWMEAVVKHTLQYVPAEKISLGIPVYSNYWFTTTTTGNAFGKITVQSVGISHQKVLYLLNKYNVTLQWDDKAKLHYAIYPHNWLYEYIFVEDARSFAAKLALVKQYHLRGISVFDLGTEDPGIWQHIRDS